MTDFTYGTVAAATSKSKPAKTAKAPARKPKTASLLRRIYEGMIEARRLEAEAMVKHHLYGGF
jgi:hypothetical protein